MANKIEKKYQFSEFFKGCAKKSYWISKDKNKLEKSCKSSMIVRYKWKLKTDYTKKTAKTRQKWKIQL